VGRKWGEGEGEGGELVRGGEWSGGVWGGGGVEER
jgi:hypothetical protein